MNEEEGLSGLQILSGVSGAFGVAGGLVNLGMSIYGMVEGEKDAEAKQKFQSDLLSAIQDLSVQLNTISIELGDIKELLAKIDNDLKGLEQAKLVELNATLEGYWDDVSSLVAPHAGEPTPQGWHDYADNIMGEAAGSVSVGITMLQIHDLLTQTVLPSSIDITGVDYLRIRAQLVRGLHLLAFGCTYSTTPHDFGNYLEKWSQNFYEQTLLMIASGDFWASWSNMQQAKPGGKFIPTLALDSIYLHNTLQPSIKAWLCTSEAYGNLRIKGTLEGSNMDTCHGMGFTADDPNQAALSVQYDQAGKITAKVTAWPETLETGVWYFDFRPDRPPDNWELCPVYLPASQRPMQQLTELSRNIAFTYDVNGESAYESPLSLGSAYGQLNVLPGSDDSPKPGLFCIADVGEFSPPYTLEQVFSNLVTYSPKEGLKIQPLKKLDSLTSAQWKIELFDQVDGNFYISPLAAEESRNPTLYLDSNGELTLTPGDLAQIKRRGFSGDPQAMQNPLNMAPTAILMTDGSVNREILFIAAPFVPSG